MSHYLKSVRGWGRYGAPTAALLMAVLVTAVLVTPAQGEGVTPIITNKSIPEATVSVIDPETGSSTGGGTTDVNVAPGDIILFQMTLTAVPDNSVRGVQSYVTDFIPANTEVVGIRIIDADGLTIPPNVYGLAPDDCGINCNSYNAVPCSSGTCNLDDGSIAQLYHDTGIWYTTSTDLLRYPDTSFPGLEDGLLLGTSPQKDTPAQVTNLAPLVSKQTNNYYAHDFWDLLQVYGFGTADSPAGNSGIGNTPWGYGSPVAGPDTHYPYEASVGALVGGACTISHDCKAVTGCSTSTCVCAGGTCYQIEFNDQNGPWERIYYPGSLTTDLSGIPTGKGGTPVRSVVVPNQSGWFDVTPNNPLPNATAVRLALGELRVGREVTVEIALRVLATPLDPVQGADVNCANVMPAVITGTGPNLVTDNPWAFHLPTAACLRLNLLFDITADRLTAGGGDPINETIFGKNLSTNPQTNVRLELRFESGRMPYSGTYTGTIAGLPAPAPVVTTCGGLDCLLWANVGDLQPSDEIDITASFTAGGIGGIGAAAYAVFSSDQLPLPGYTTMAITAIKPIALTNAELDWTAPLPQAAAGGTATLTGSIANDGHQAANYDTIELLLPAGWSIDSATLDGVALACDAPINNLASCTVPGAVDDCAEGQTRALEMIVDIPVGASGLYDIDLAIRGTQSAQWKPFEMYYQKVTAISVGEPRSDAPVIDCPVDRLDTTITGTSTEADGTVVTIYFNGYPRGTAVVTGGAWSFTGYGASFGELYAGLEVRVTGEAGSESVSILSAACSVSTTPVCSDGLDNDGDGYTDFPSDPGCSSPLDGSEEDPPTPECSDTIDNDGDGHTDWPDDLSCSSPTDTTETGAPECSDGIDNDGDGIIDFAGGDPGCDDANDSNEIEFRECQDLLDNETISDGVADFLTDPGCHSWNDDDERDFSFPDDIYARLLILFDTSGSMNWNACDQTFTGGDGSSACGGDDVLCADCNASGCGDGLPNDSRMYKVKDGLSDAVIGYGSVEWGLMRFHQKAMDFQCPTTNASLQSGGWQGAGSAPCGGVPNTGVFNTGDLLVGFSPDNAEDLLEWMDHDSNYPGTPPAGMDFELRGSGTTPLGGSLNSAGIYLTDTQSSDPVAACRPYRVILVTDGGETCGGDPVASAAALDAVGIPVHVIGFATSDVAIINSLNAIAAAGGTSEAVFADDKVSLSAAIASIISDSILVEYCNDADDDCDGLVDEDFPSKGDACDNGELGICNLPGIMVCTSDGLGTECNAPGGTAGTETCNGLDDDCDGSIDEGGVCAGPEICNGVDDYGDGYTTFAEGAEDPRVGQPCGSDVGACTEGTQFCWVDPGNSTNVEIRCDDTGPTVEVCDTNIPANDQNCNGINNDGVPPQACSLTTSYGTCDGMAICDVDGAWVSCSAPPAQPEACNNFDDNCNGDVDEGLSQPCSETNAEGTCTGIETCTTGTWGGCTAATPVAEWCNNNDDDCDGAVDEGLSKPCNNGLCTGVEICTTGTWGGCTAATPATEICNGLDDDCDGATDENLDRGCYTGSAVTLNVGLCVGGTESCIGGSYGSCVGQVIPVAEICNGDDDDCDGPIDEGLGQTTCGVGVCQNTVDNCSGGVSQNCDPFLGSTPETCDGLDNDCDGVSDGLTEACYGFASGCTLVGTAWVCVGTCVSGTHTCPAGGAGVWDTSCDGDVGPGDETCDGLDNDCDGTVDSFNQACYPGGYGTTTGCTAAGTCVGACTEGTQTCTTGAWGGCTGWVTPIPEVCNNVDDDCDGSTDEGLSQACVETNAEGTCTGVETCSAGGWVGCTADTPAAETCNNADDDCDGAVDEGLTQVCYPDGYGPATGCTAPGTCVGVCHEGTETCTAGTYGSCVGLVTPGPEVCDGLDNDCDGLTDEDAGGNPLTQPCYTGPVNTDGVGICTAGTRTCSGGSWSTCVGEVVPQTETCDGLDNNCNTQIDENLGQTTCGLGTCQHTVDNCVNGSPQTCDPLEGAGVETCDGLDNDCDGVVDGLQRSCYTPASGCTETGGVYTCQGTCAPGLDVCSSGSGGTWTGCQFDVGPSPEICDNLDNDCDGLTDEDVGGGPLTDTCYSPGSGPNTGCTYDASSLSWTCLGECSSGTRTCAVGVWGGCAGEVTPTVETCNTLDDDCDGETDEATDIPGLNQPCGNALGRCTPGILLCIEGQELCQGGDGPYPGECNLQDDDCDGEVDEPDEVMDGSGLPCGEGEGACEPGHTECIGGEWQCMDEVLASQEVCDGIDNDCDGVVDNGDLCPENYYCVEVTSTLTECRPVCQPGEFPCDPGDICTENVVVGSETVDICMPDFGDCDPPCDADEECVEGVCVDPCEGVNCEWWEECAGGACVDRSCTGIGQTCGPDQFCMDHTCVDDPCAQADCEAGEYCIPQCDSDGCTGASCEPLCYCHEGMACDGQGGCVEDVCADVQCGLGERCDPATGICEDDPCAAVAPFCNPSEACFEGECIDDPCGQIDCPPTFDCILFETTDEFGDPVPQPICRADPDTYIPGVDGDLFLATGDGGCACQSTSDGQGAGLLTLLLALLWFRRRRRRFRAEQDRGEVA